MNNQTPLQATSEGAQTVPNAQLEVAAPEVGPVQEAQRILMNGQQTPHAMALEYGKLKSDLLAKAYGVTVDQ